MMLWLLDSALRSFLFGLSVWTVLKLLRVRDVATETILWTTVLVVSLSMPLLSHYLPSVVVTVPRIFPVGRASPVPIQLAGADDTALRLFRPAGHGQGWLLAGYVLGLVVCLTRLSIGLLRSLRLYLNSVPVKAGWAKGGHIRVNASLKGPASLARVILVPADYREWSATKRDAVLAHEGAHIARGDFFVQLVALLHCAFFWFSPFAWWLKSKLAEVAENASDDAAIRCLNDRATYAEMLLQVACGAQQLPAIVAMARGPSIQQRIERILSGGRSRNLSAPLRVLIMGSLPVVALGLASTRAAMASTPSDAPPQRTSPLKAEVKMPSSMKADAETPVAVRFPERIRHAAARSPKTAAITQGGGTGVSYNPRALLDPVYMPARPYGRASTIVHAGRTFYILSTDRPVAETSAVDGAFSQDN